MDEVDFRSHLENMSLIAFGDAFVSSPNYTLVKLELTSDLYDFCYFSDDDNIHSDFDDKLAQRLKRRLAINVERASSVETFTQFSHAAKGPDHHVPFADVFAVHPAIVFEYARKYEWGLLTAIEETTSDSGSTVASAKAFDHYQS